MLVIKNKMIEDLIDDKIDIGRITESVSKRLASNNIETKVEEIGDMGLK